MAPTARGMQAARPLEQSVPPELREERNLLVPTFDHERVESVVGARSGVRIVVALHSSRLGAALGGCRVWTYDDWVDGLFDALRLSAAMTLKNAAAGLHAGGGKAVIALGIGETLEGGRRQAALLDLGDIVERFGGSYVTAEDVGTTERDMEIVAERTRHVVGLPAHAGGVGDPSGATAEGVVAAIGSVMLQLDGARDLRDKTFVVSGFGQVGSRVVERLVSAGAQVFVTDLDASKRDRARQLGSTWIPAADALRQSADAFVPAGVGGILDDAAIDGLRVRAVVGPANNPLASRHGAERLRERGILYAPDFVVNAGGVIHLTLASEGRSAEEIAHRVESIGVTLDEIFERAAMHGTTPLFEAEQFALSRIRDEGRPITQQ